MAVLFAFCARYPRALLGSYWCAHAAFFLVFSWRPFETFDDAWWRDLSAHAIAGYTLLISLAIALRRPCLERSLLRSFGEWFLVGRSYMRAVAFGIVESLLWEGLEFVLDRVREYLPFFIAVAQGGWWDTALDIAVALPMAMFAMACVRRYERRRAVRESVPVCAVH